MSRASSGGSGDWTESSVVVGDPHESARSCSGSGASPELIGRIAAARGRRSEVLVGDSAALARSPGRASAGDVRHGAGPASASTASAVSSLLVRGHVQRRVGVEELGQLGQAALRATAQLRLELGEPADLAAVGDDRDLVQAQFDARAGIADLAPAADLADRDAFDERRPCRHVPGRRIGPPRSASRRGRSVGSAGPSSSSRRTAPPGPVAVAERLDRDGRARTSTGAGGPRSRRGPSRRRRCRRSDPRSGSPWPARGHRTPRPGAASGSARRRPRPSTRYFSSTSTGAGGGDRFERVGHARGSSEPAPAPGRWGTCRTSPRVERVLLEGLERVDRAAAGR